MKIDIPSSVRTALPAPLDETDRALVQALQIDGRAPFSRISEVLGVSDQTVARRYARLRGEGVLRVLGLTDSLRLGETPWLVKLRCAPEAAGAIGEALARRPETSWVSLTSGGTEITCAVRSYGPGHADALLLQQLPRTPKVLDVSAYCLLHVFFGQDRSPLTKSGPLSEEQTAALRSPDACEDAVCEPGVRYPLDEGDRRMLDVLARDGRTPIGELAEAIGWSQTTVRRRMAELRRAGVLYFDLDYHVRLVDSGLRAQLWLEVDPARLPEAGEALAEHPEVSFAAATTGDSNLYATFGVADAASFYRYLTGPVAALPGLRRTATAPNLRTLKGPGPYRAEAPGRGEGMRPLSGRAESA